MIVKIEEDENGELILPIPKELTEGDNPWLVGDKITWTINEDGSCTLVNETWNSRQE